MKQILFILSFIIMLSACNDTAKNNHGKLETQSKNDLYDNFGVIKVEDKLAKNIGYKADSADVYFISLRDVGKYHGKVCPGIATGFKMIKDVLDSLYPNEIVQRGQVQVLSSKPTDLFDVAGYITGARNFYGRGEINRGDLIIDTTLNPHQHMSFAMVFRRKDNGQAYKVVFHKANLVAEKDRDFIFSVDKEALLGEVDKDTAKKFLNITNTEVKQILENGIRTDVYEIEKLK
jgi:formylmethanofuran dehydrogenase subunit E